MVNQQLLIGISISVGLLAFLVVAVWKRGAILRWSISPGTGGNAAVLRRLFYRDARSLDRREFNRWFSLSAQAPALLRALRRSSPPVPTLHVMGARDRMFLGGVRRLAAADGSAVQVFANAGHVSTVEAAAAFNTLAPEFLRRQGRAAPLPRQSHR